VDKDDVLFGVIAPPCEDPGQQREFIEEMEKLMKFGLYDETNAKRGPFKTIPHGIQMGPGSPVNTIFSTSLF
jgi:hypothetical protein